MKTLLLNFCNFVKSYGTFKKTASISQMLSLEMAVKWYHDVLLNASLQVPYRVTKSKDGRSRAGGRRALSTTRRRRQRLAGTCYGRGRATEHSSHLINHVLYPTVRRIPVNNTDQCACVMSSVEVVQHMLHVILSNVSFPQM